MERVDEYSKLPSEEPPSAEHQRRLAAPPPGWPTEGVVEFKHVGTKNVKVETWKYVAHRASP